MATSSFHPPGIPEALRLSTQVWQSDLLQLFHNAKNRFPDVIWEFHSDDDDDSTEEVWGHKAIVYARAPPSFQARYFSFRSPPPSPSPEDNSRSLSPYCSSSPSPSTNEGSILRIPQQISPALFSNELECLYAGKGVGDAFEFLFDTSESCDVADTEEKRIDSLRKDLVYMWRSRLYSDIRISLTGTFSKSNPERTTAIFPTHRFILVSRSPQLLTCGANAAIAVGSSAPGEPLTVTLPSPPFTPASLRFTLGYIYTGTLVFSDRTYDLDTAFAILRSANYLSLPELYNEIQARIVFEMLHGLYHAFLKFDEYECITHAKWGIGGCRCRQCARRIPRVLEFVLSDDIANNYLERGARRALVGLFGEGWCNAEFAALPPKIRDSVVKGVGKRTTPTNVFLLLFAAQHALKKLDAAIEAWADISREMILTARKTIDACLVKENEICFEQAEWVEMLEGDGVGFEDGERAGWVMEALKRGMSERYAAIVYQTLVSSILLRPHAIESDATMLSRTSQIRAQVEEACVDLVRWIRKRWMRVRQEGGFDALEGWSIKEISQEIDVPVEDLISPASHYTLRNPHLSRALRLSLIRESDDSDSDALSVHSLRASVLLRTIPASPTQRVREWAQVNLTRESWKDTLAHAVRFTLPRDIIYQVICECLEAINCVTDAVECFLQMTNELGGEINLSSEHSEWAVDFRQRSFKRLEHLGDTATDARQYDEAISHCTTALSLNLPSSQNISMKRSKAFVATGSWKQALDDANQVIMLDPSSQLHGVHRIVTTVDTYADETIISILMKLNAEVQQNTTYMAEGISSDFQLRTTNTTEEQLSATQRVSKSIGKALADCLASMKCDEVVLYLSIAFQAYFSYYLCQIISSWSIEGGHNDFINQIYERLQKTETPPMPGRWRAFMRACIRPAWMSDPSCLTQQIAAGLSDVVVAAGCAASATAANSKLSSFMDQVLSIVSIAGQFCKMIGEADFAVTAPPPLQMFEETTMEQDVDDYDKLGEASGRAAGQKVLCSTHLGLMKRMQRESKETLTVVKAVVVLESFLDG